MLVSFFHSIANLLRTWSQRQRERVWLMELDSHMLQDMGISSSEAWQEARKPFWKA
ncbi:MAG TPA: DUF1127 domain-containing protein [Salinisphaeraceae bacterium]|nr:DUF1127 domain-containing protein [Salinisphaeraceae bacterium]